MSSVTTVPARPGAALPAPGFAVTVLLAFGPLVSVALLAHAGARGQLAAPVSVFVASALLFWSPLPFSFAAVLLEAHRDAVWPGSRGPARLVRGLVLVPVLLARPASRTATVASLVGFAGAVVAGWPYLADLPLPYLAG